MASARYTLNIDPEELKPEPPKEYTKKEKLQNWWHYHWQWVAAILVAIAIVGYMVHDVLNKVQPDYQIAVISAQSIPADLQTKLSQALSAYGTDQNGDGQVSIKLNCYALDLSQMQSTESAAPSTGQSQEPTAQAAADLTEGYVKMAAMATLDVDLQNGDSVIFLVDDLAAWQQICTDLAQPGQAVYAWQDCPVLANLPLEAYTDLAGENPQNSQAYLSRFFVTSRSFDADAPEHLEADMALFDALTAEGRAA